MVETPLQRLLVLALRLMMGWVFFYAGTRQIFMIDNWSAASFLAGAKTFKPFYDLFTAPALAPAISFLVKWGHFLIGLSLISGLLVRVSGLIGALLMILYYFPRLDGWYVAGPNNLIVEYHLVYATVLVYLVVAHAGRVFGLDGRIDDLPVLKDVVARKPGLRALFS